MLPLFETFFNQLRRFDKQFKGARVTELFMSSDGNGAKNFTGGGIANG
jgi:hypothetical protein